MLRPMRLNMLAFGACRISAHILSLRTVVLVLALIISTRTAAAELTIEFDIPAQPLDSALDAFSKTTGTVGAYNGNLTIGVHSDGLRGRYAPKTALELLLKDTGLVGEFTAQSAFVVIPSDQPLPMVTKASAIAQAALSGQNTDERRYSALLQESVGRSLCAQSAAQAGKYRAVVSFWVNASGEIMRPKLLSSTGDDQRDAAISAALGRLDVGEPPPPGMAQPFTMIILPPAPGGTVLCSPAERPWTPQ
jgi:TonB family protein